MITLCGHCGKEKCECQVPAAICAPVPQPAKDWGDEPTALLRGWGVASNAPQNCRCYAEPLVESPIVLPDILETAIYGQQR